MTAHWNTHPTTEAELTTSCEGSGRSISAFQPLSLQQRARLQSMWKSTHKPSTLDRTLLPPRKQPCLPRTRVEYSEPVGTHLPLPTVASRWLKKTPIPYASFPPDSQAHGRVSVAYNRTCHPTHPSPTQRNHPTKARPHHVTPLPPNDSTHHTRRRLPAALATTPEAGASIRVRGGLDARGESNEERRPCKVGSSSSRGRGSLPQLPGLHLRQGRVGAWLGWVGGVGPREGGPGRCGKSEGGKEREGERIWAFFWRGEGGEGGGR